MELAEKESERTSVVVKKTVPIFVSRTFFAIKVEEYFRIVRMTNQVMKLICMSAK